MFPAMAATESLSQRAARSVNHPLTRALLVLTFTTGLVDGVSYLGLGHVFTANMTGNIVFLGFGLAGGTGLPVVAPIVSLLAFLVGAGAGGVLAVRLADRHPVHIGIALGIEVTLLAIAAMLVGALVGALELKVSLVVPLITAAALVLLTNAVYVPAARAEAQK